MIYTTIGSISAAGNSSSYNEYSFRDNHAPAKELFYRLKQVDFDGNVHYPGRIVRVDNADAARMPIISPNPNDGRQFTLNLSALGDNEVLVRIVNEMGTVVWQQSIDLKNYDSKFIPVNTGRDFNPGIYTVHITGLSGQNTKRFMVSKREE